ncbi:hypothetical protein AB0O04_33795, partial [Streptomyces althioticus]|uniref:hypothetical protein n=1 Tax=Streptomyces althioticus TaxID=83380 RepID=UPI003426BCDD
DEADGGHDDRRDAGRLALLQVVADAKPQRVGYPISAMSPERSAMPMSEFNERTTSSVSGREEKT